jgi:hypothetical protein
MYTVKNMNLDQDIFCFWREWANKKFNWFQTDSEEKYQEHLKTRPGKLKELGWIDNSFTYEFNSLGFRCKEITDTDSIMFLGCSVTVGVGLPNHSIFPTLIAEKLNLQCVNMGVGGTSSDTAFRIASLYIEKVRPKILVATLLFPERTELLTGQGVVRFNPEMLSLKNLHKLERQYTMEYYEKWIEIPETAHINQMKNILAINKLCDMYNVKFVSQTASRIPINFYNQARDLMHPGTEYHEKLAEIILEKI